MTIAEPRVREILRAAGWPRDELENALTISYHESRWNPRAYNKDDPSGGSFGLFQINAWWCYFGEAEIGEHLDSGSRHATPLQRPLRPAYLAEVRMGSLEHGSLHLSPLMSDFNHPPLYSVDISSTPPANRVNE